MMSVAQPLVQASLLGEAIDGGPVAVFVADEHMRYVAVNRFACELLGYSREELLERTVLDVARTSDAGERYASMIADGAQRGAIVLTAKDGSEVVADYLAQETTVAGMTFFVSVAVPRAETPG